MATPELSHRNHIGWSSASGWLVGEKGKLQDTACSQAVFCLVMAHTHTHTRLQWKRWFDWEPFGYGLFLSWRHHHRKSFFWILITLAHAQIIEGILMYLYECICTFKMLYVCLWMVAEVSAGRKTYQAPCSRSVWWWCFGGGWLCLRGVSVVVM